MSIITKKNKLHVKKSSVCGGATSVLQVYSLAAVGLIALFIFNYIPMGGLIVAFKNYRYDLGIFGSEWVGLKNFDLLVKSSDFLKITRNTLLFNVIFIITGTIAQLVLAILMYEISSRRATKLYQTIMITPNFLSWVIVGYMAYAMLHPQHGYVNKFLESMGIDAIDWYSKPSAWYFILPIVNIWKGVGINSIIYYAALMGIDETLYEAADIDGAGKMKKIISITIPELVSLISIMIILSIGNIFRGDFGLFYQLTRDSGALYDATDVIDTYVVRATRNIGDFGVSSAIGFLQSVVGFVLVMITNYVSKKIDSNNALF